MARQWIVWSSAALLALAAAAAESAPAANKEPAASEAPAASEEPAANEQPAANQDPAYEFPSASAVTRGADLRGRIVETRDGEELGRVHDLAVDLASGRLAYVVVSVGSFLIDDSLIAVAPDALRASADADGRLVLETDSASLRRARRFSDGDWPRRADVLAQADAAVAAADPAAGPASAAGARGTATISDGNKTATLSAGERRIEFVEPPPPAAPAPAASGSGQQATATARPVPTTRFGRLDRDGNGTLNRAEIAHEMRRGDRFADIDSDGSGAIDEVEFEVLLQSRSGG